MKANAPSTKRLLNTAKGQIEGVLRMVEEDRYCIEISHQLLATIAILKKINRNILHAHLNECVLEACDLDEKREKLDEIARVLDTLSR